METGNPIPFHKCLSCGERLRQEISDASYRKFLPWIRCLVCRGAVEDRGEVIGCILCTNEYRVVDGIPILVRPGNFDIHEEHLGRYFRCRPRLLNRIITPRFKHRSASCLVGMASEIISSVNEVPRILVIGGGEIGIGLGRALRMPGICWFETDIYRGSRTQMIVDGHDLPFEDGAFHGIVMQSVLEHVRDPGRVASEAMRVLRRGGLLFSQAAFMQQVHEGWSDYFRFTPRAHRLLFAPLRLESWGPSLGPATALVWSFRYLLRAILHPVPCGRAAAYALACLALLPAYGLDHLLSRSRWAIDGASETYLLLRKVHPPVVEMERFPEKEPE